MSKSPPLQQPYLPSMAISLPRSSSDPTVLSIPFTSESTHRLQTTNMSTSTPASTSTPTPTLSAVAAVASEGVTKAAQWKGLTDKFDETRMRQHQWEYNKDYMPIYRYQPAPRICDIWVEWSTGLNGYLPVRNLNEAWGARWRRGDRGQSTESSRRMRVVELINKLSAKSGWDLALAQRFLLERYEGKMTTRKFCDYIQKNGGAGSNEIMKAALSYPA